ncbi:Retrovirus-related Pol polyprotein from transposon opus [Trichinella pseudospiralis]|uniref:Retrovirus-related Pol polyprotein from transposon opus n=1 Tax=Trichinella pseudospiralis TaxID=6337 RepID=A0A0V1FWW6_TRIPS|nr:Retrovirus-related Pol polyprotein from transposon opus [Trichinella pseudospiralis]
MGTGGNVTKRDDASRRHKAIPERAGPPEEHTALLQEALNRLRKATLFPRMARLQFGIASAPGIFQRFMDSLLANLDDVVPHFDDMPIAADSQHELLEKCVFVSNSVEFLGYQIDAEGIYLSEEKVEAIHKVPRPKNKQEPYFNFLRLLKFYHNFLENKAGATGPLYLLLDKTQYDYQLPNNTEIAKRKMLQPTEKMSKREDRKKSRSTALYRSHRNWPHLETTR